MGVLDRIKQAFSSAAVIAASVRTVDGWGTKGAKARPFNADAAIRAFDHWAYAAAMLNANAVANVPLRIYARQRPGARALYETRKLSPIERKRLAGPDSAPSVRRKVAAFAGELVEVVEPHPALRVLQTVNPWQNGYELTVLRMLDLQITGNSYLHPVFSGLGVPAELWRMPSQNTKVIPDRTRFIAGYVYGRGTEVERTFGADEVIQFKMPNPDDLFYGMGWYQAAWSAIGLHGSKRQMDLSKFDNMARPDWLLSVPAGTKPEAMDRFEANVNQKLRGPKKSGGFLTITGDVKATALNLDVPEVGTATRVIEEISAVSGVPVAMLLSNDPNRANSESARTGWYRNTIRPYCRLDEEKLNERYLPLFDGADDLVLAYDECSFEDEDRQMKRLVGGVAGGVFKANEARAELGFEPVEGGDVLYPPGGTSGQAAGVAGDMSPGQNGDRQNESPAAPLN